MIVRVSNLLILSLTLASSRSIPRPRNNQRSLVNPAANAPLKVDRQYQEASLHSNSPLRRQSLPIVLLDDEADKSRVIDVEELKDIFNKVESNRNRVRETNPEPVNRLIDEDMIKLFEMNPKFKEEKQPANNFKTFDYEILEPEPNAGNLKKKNRDPGNGKEKDSDFINIQILDLNDLKDAKAKSKNVQNLDILNWDWGNNRPYSEKYKTENPVETVWQEYSKFNLPLNKGDGDVMTHVEHLFGANTKKVPKKNGNANKRFKTSQDDINSILLNLNKPVNKDDKTNYQIINLDSLFDSDHSEKDRNKKVYNTKDTSDINLEELLESIQNSEPKDISNKENFKILNLDENQNTDNIYDKILDIVRQDQETSKGNGAKSKKKITLIDLDSLADGVNKQDDSASDFIDLDRLTSEKDLKAAREANLRTLMQKVDLEDITKNVKNDVNALKQNDNIGNNKELNVLADKGMVYLTEPKNNRDKQLNYVLDKAVWLQNKNNQKATLRRPSSISNSELNRLRNIALAFGQDRAKERNSQHKRTRLRRDENEALINFDDLVV